MHRYPIPAGRARTEQVVQRSRFITTGARASSVEEARAFIAEMRSEFSDATHNCYAFLVGPPGSTARIGSSDDGEPAGTAGRPMLSILLGCGLGDIVVVVTRYYGGTKLGTGGLVKAYGSGVRAVLAALPTEEKVARVRLVVSGPYRWISPLERLLVEFEAHVVEESFDAGFAWGVTVPEDLARALTLAVGEISRGELEVRS